MERFFSDELEITGVTGNLQTCVGEVREPDCRFHPVTPVSMDGNSRIPHFYLTTDLSKRHGHMAALPDRAARPGS